MRNVSRKALLAGMALVAACAIGSPSGAQTGAQPSSDPSKPPAHVAEKMPFDIPYGISIGIDQAKQLANAAEAEAKKHGWKMNIAVVDIAGELIYFERMADAQVASVKIAEGKAHTAARYRRSSRLFWAAMENGHPYVPTLDPTLVASPGGLPLVEGGKLIGAIGCSGGTGDQDEATCMAGAELVK